MASAFPENTASSPVRHYPKKQAVLEAVCILVTEEKELKHRRGHQFPTHILIQPLTYAYSRGSIRTQMAARSQNT